MKQISISIFAVILCLAAFRVVSPAAQAAPEPIYHIAYLLDRDAEFENEFVRPENLLKDLVTHQVDIAYSWQDLMQIQARKPLDALVIHASALPMVDFEWVANAYWRGMILSTLDIQPSMLAHLYDDGCLPFGYTMPVPEEGPYVTIGLRLFLSVHDATQVAKWYRRDWRHNCEYPEPAEITKPTEWGYTFMSAPLVSESLHKIYQSYLLEDLQFAHEARERFIEEHKDPQFIGTRLSR